MIYRRQAAGGSAAVTPEARAARRSYSDLYITETTRVEVGSSRQRRARHGSLLLVSAVPRCVLVPATVWQGSLQSSLFAAEVPQPRAALLTTFFSRARSLDASDCALLSEDYPGTRSRLHFQLDFCRLAATGGRPAAASAACHQQVALIASSGGKAGVALHPTEDASALQPALDSVQPAGEANLATALKLALVGLLLPLPLLACAAAARCALCIGHQRLQGAAAAHCPHLALPPAAPACSW